MYGIVIPTRGTSMYRWHSRKGLVYWRDAATSYETYDDAVGAMRELYPNREDAYVAAL